MKLVLSTRPAEHLCSKLVCRFAKDEHYICGNVLSLFVIDFIVHVTHPLFLLVTTLFIGPAIIKAPVLHGM
jgi:hypothetical protein